jgi:hypothetical protein
VLALGAATLGPTMLAGAASDQQLTVDVTGNGYVTDATGAIHCPPTCQSTLPSTAQVQLYAYPNGYDTFQGWSGACQGTTKCSFDMSQDRQVGAAFTGAGPSPTPSPSPSPTATPTPGPSATPTPGPSPTPSPGPTKLAVTTVKVQSLAFTHGAVRLFLRCPLKCVALLKTTVSVPHGTAAVVRLKSVRRTLPAGVRTLVRLHLPRALRSAIRRRASRRHPAIARVTITTNGSAPVRRTVSLIP